MRSLTVLLLWLCASHAGLAREAAVFTESESCAAALERPAPAAASPLPAVLRIGSWNIMKEEIDGAATLLNDLAADAELFLTQEGIETSATPTPHALQRYFAPGYRRGDVLTGIALTSTANADVLCKLQFQEPWLRTPKAVLAARLPMGEGALLAVNLHGINFTLGSGAYRRQLNAIASLIDVHNGPVLVAGDMNHWNPWRRRVLREFAEGAGLTEAVFTPDLRSRHLGSPVDSAFVRGLEVLSAVAVPTSLSDHHPLMLVLHQTLPPGADTPAAGAPPAPGR